MIDRDTLLETLQTFRTHKMRTALALLTVAWGVFMLVLLLGFGRGIQNGVELQFKDDAINSIRVYRGKTTIDFAGHPRGRSISLENADYRDIKNDVDNVEHISTRFYPGGEALVTYAGNHGSFDIRAVHPDHVYLEKSIITAGRFINQLDIERQRKVCAIGIQVAEALFGKSFDERDVLGQTIAINGIGWLVTGLFRDEGRQSEQEKIYLPVSTAQLVYGAPDKVNQILFTVGDASYQQSQQSELQTRALLAQRHHFDVADERAVRIYNNLDEYKKITDLFYWVRVFVALVGAGTVLTGILAVGNIMMISVAERRREIGIRKALGATTGSITRLIVIESLLITSIAGYLGLLLSLGLLELLKALVGENEYFYQPDVNTAVVAGVTLLVIVAGTVAGYIPARRAAAVNPVEALQPT